MSTARDICTDALRKITVLAEDETMSAAQAVNTLRALNVMLDSWSVDKSLIYTVQEQGPYTLTAGDGIYTIGSGGDFATTRPIDILGAWCRDASNNDYPLAVWGVDQYEGIGQKTLQGVPQVISYLSDFPLGTLRLWPVPIADGPLNLFIQTRKQFTSFALDDTVSMPPGYERAFIFNLAVEAAPDNQKTPSDVVADIAMASREVVRRVNLPDQVASYDAELSGRRGGGAFNIYRGS
jgi:hypothetical protein